MISENTLDKKGECYGVFCLGESSEFSSEENESESEVCLG